MWWVGSWVWDAPRPFVGSGYFVGVGLFRGGRCFRRPPPCVQHVIPAPSTVLSALRPTFPLPHFPAVHRPLFALSTAPFSRRHSRTLRLSGVITALNRNVLACRGGKGGTPWAGTRGVRDAWGPGLVGSGACGVRTRRVRDGWGSGSLGRFEVWGFRCCRGRLPPWFRSLRPC